MTAIREVGFSPELSARRVQTGCLEKHSALIPPIAAALVRRPSVFSTLCEIGCGAGRLLRDSTERLPQLREYVGLDSSLAQTERNRVRHIDLPIRFEAGDADTWIPEHAVPGWIYLSDAGVLEYFSEQQLLHLFGHIASNKKPALFALAEPIASEYDLSSEARSHPRGIEPGLRHTCVHLLNRCGWSVPFQMEQMIGATRYRLLVAEV